MHFWLKEKDRLRLRASTESEMHEVTAGNC